MHCPAFTISRIGHFTTARVTEESREVLRPVVTPNYELEFYYQDCPGGLTINGTRYPVRAGGFTCCKPGQMRKLNLPYRCYFFNIYTQDPALSAMLDNLPDYGMLQDVHSQKILSLCQEMNAVVSINSVEGKMQVAGYICQILGFLAQQLHLFPGLASHSTLLHQKALVDADNYIRDHLTEEVDLNKLAKIANLHPTYFHKLFTAAYNSTPVQQLYFHRVMVAQQLLVNGNMTLAEIAEECGFSSQSFFSTKFKEASGISPSAFRKKARNLNTKK